MQADIFNRRVVLCCFFGAETCMFTSFNRALSMFFGHFKARINHDPTILTVFLWKTYACNETLNIELVYKLKSRRCYPEEAQFGKFGSYMHLNIFGPFEHITLILRGLNFYKS